MKKELSFGQEVSFKPLLASLFLGVVVAVISYSIFPTSPVWWMLLGIIAFLVDSLVVYPTYWTQTYGLWGIDTMGIIYYDYSGWKNRVAGLFLPFWQVPKKLSFKDIKSFSIIDGKTILNSENILGGKLFSPSYRRQHYLLLESTDQSVIKLNLSWTTKGTAVDQTDLAQIVQLLNSKIN